MNFRDQIAFAFAAAVMLLSPGASARAQSQATVSAIVSKAAQADPALAAAVADLDVPLEIAAPESAPAPTPATPVTAARESKTPALSAELEPRGAGGPTFSERLSRLCSDKHRISFDCVESPAIAMMNIAEENHRESPATYWTVGALGLILGAILFIPALLISLVTGIVSLIHDIATGS